MKRDIELIRLLLTENETETEPEQLANYPKPLQLYNIGLMKDAGLIDADIIKDSGGNISAAEIRGLTWAGHDFLDATKDSKIWKKVKEHIIKPGASWTFQALIAYLKQEVEKKLRGKDL